MKTPPASTIAIDPGTRFLRIARTRADGTPALVDLPGTVPGEGLPTPAEIRGDREAALSLAYTTYREHCGIPGQLVLVVPPGERTVPPGDGRMPPPRLLDTPHAVLALLRHAGTPIARRLFMCDLGASAAGVTECADVGGAIAMVPAEPSPPADGGYGAAADNVVLEGVGLSADDTGVLLELGEARAHNARRIEVALDRMASHPDRADRFADTVLFGVAGQEITAGLVHQSLGRLTDGLDKALAGLPGVSANRPDPFRTPVIVVGGAARFGALLRHLTGRLGRPVPLPDGTDPALAAVFGAALVAGEHVEPADRYPHAVSVRVHRTAAGRPRDEELLISPPGTLEPGGATVFAEADGERLRVRTGPADGTGGRDVRILVRAAGTGTAAPVGVVTIPPAGDGARFHVGVRLATDGTARLVLQPFDHGRSDTHQAGNRRPEQPPPAEFPLGVLPADLQPDPPPDTQGART
ncbi:sugar kinase [Streptomyces cyaneochromogenes]|uniref:Sugar kinase n=1 Tax=Streptomyces cyaneochromogenes TaxID=2496836 RepID=A0A3Q9EXQ7_9ACTN|nr:sugar kinase [Streptomyces cyaneochromogenes]AZQ38080.1 sugar kinase [Streptomyces cyaneochromogenes]